MKTFSLKTLVAILFIGLFIVGQPIAVYASNYDKGYNDAGNGSKNLFLYVLSGKYRNGYEEGLEDVHLYGESIMAVFGLALIVLMWAGLFFVGIYIYFLPTFIASSRSHENSGGIFFLNIFAGMTGGFLWILLFLWAALGQKKNV